MLARDNAGNIEATPTFSTQILIDLVAPNSAVAALPVYTTTPSITVSWSGSDPTVSEASGLAAFDVYVTSTLVPAPTLWLHNVTSTTAQYDGQDGVQYGFYTIATDNAGNVEAAPAQADAVILVDTTPPTSAVDALPIYGNQNTFTVSWAGNDPSTGIASGLATFDVFVSTDGTTFTPWLTDTVLMSALYTGSGVSGLYWFYSLATDHAGNIQAAPSYTATTLVDLEKPVSAVDALPTYRGPSFAVAWSGSDTGGSGLLDYTVYYTTSLNATPVAWLLDTTNTSATFTGAVDGVTYYFYSIARDQAGNVEDATGPDAHISIDITPPSSAVEVLPTYTASLTFTVRWSGADATSGVASYDVYTSTDGITYHRWLNDVAGTSAIFTGVNGQTYRFYSRATDWAGNEEAAPGTADAETLVDGVAPTSAASSPAYSTAAAFAVTWTGSDAESSVASYDVYVAVDGGGYTRWLTATTATSAVFTGTHGHTYHFYSRATDAAGNVETAPASADTSTLVDLVAPTSAVAALPAFVNTTAFSVTWSGSDAASGIAGYDLYYAIGAGPFELWLANTPATAATFTYGAHGYTYRFYSRATDAAGNEEAAPAVADAVSTVDLVAPESAASLTGLQPGSTTFTVTWSGTDDLSGIASYDVYSATAAGGPYHLWQAATTETAAAFTGVDGVTYYFYSRATDAAGNVEAAPATYDASTLADATPPTSTLSALGTYQTNASFALAYAANDPLPGSGLAYVELYYRHNGGAWTQYGGAYTASPIAFTAGADGLYEFYVEATDNRGNVEVKGTAEVSTIVDTVAPASAVDGLPPYTANLTFTVSWAGTDATAGVASYDVYSSTDGVTYHLWLADTTATSAVFTGVNGQTYHFYSRATDAAGNEEAAPASADTSTLVDLVAPTSAVAALPAFVNTTAFSVTWSGSDATSGLAHYDVYVSDNGAPYALWQAGVVVTSATYSGAVNGHTYRFYSRATDAAGNEEAAPSAPDAQTTISLDEPTSVVSPLLPYQTTNNFLVMWSGSDPIWGVRDYTIYVSVDGGPYTAWLTDTALTAAYYTGAHGHTYAFYSRARNHAGVVEDAPASADATTMVDTVRPTSAVSALPRYSTIPTLTVAWNGSDNGSGLAFYDVYMSDTGASFEVWQPNVTITTAQHIGADGHEYAFYSLATDNAGNVQDRPTRVPFTLVDLTPPASQVAALPPLQHTLTFTVTWGGDDPSSGIPSGLDTYDVYVSTDGGVYTLWQPAVSFTEAVFTGVNKSVYRFYSVARDKAGNVEPVPAVPDAETQLLTEVTLTINVEGPGTTTPAPGVYTYTYDTNMMAVVITATPNVGASFLGWSGDLSGAANPATVLMDADKVVTATFISEPVFSLRIAVDGTGEGATTPPAGTYNYPAGTQVILTATAATGSAFMGWSGAVEDTAPIILLTLDADKVVTATFDLLEYTLTINAEGPGTTTPTPGVYTYTHGTSVLITATPNVGADFLGWSGDLSGTATPATVLMDGDKVVTATFTTVVVPTYTLTMAVQGNGTVSPVVGPHVYDANTVVPITATAAVDWQFVGWTGDVADANAVSTTVIMNADKTVIANFEQTKFTIFLPLVIRAFGK